MTHKRRRKIGKKGECTVKRTIKSYYCAYWDGIMLCEGYGYCKMAYLRKSETE